MGAALDAPPTAAVVVCTSDEWYVRISELRDAFERSRALWLPLAAFDGRESAVRYGLAQLAGTDFEAIPGRHHAALDLLASSARQAVVDGRGTDLAVAFAPEVGFGTIAGVEVPLGDFTPLLGIFEVEAEFPDAGDHPPVIVNGILRPDGVLAAHGPRGFVPGDPRVEEARRTLASVLSGSVRPVIEIIDSSIMRFDFDGTDVAESFRRLAGDECGLRLTEFSIGVNDIAADTIQWGVNSPLNEGVQGIHLGIGDGYSGIHVDFMSAGASLVA